MATPLELGADLQSIVERLKATAPALRAVGGSANLDAAMKADRFPTNSAYVLPAQERGGENHVATDGASGEGYAQLAEVSFSVLLIAKNVADARGAAAHGDLRSLRGEVFRALANWVPAWASLPVEWDSGALAEVRPGEIWWEDVYRTAVILEA